MCMDMEMNWLFGNLIDGFHLKIQIWANYELSKDDVGYVIVECLIC